MILSHFVGDVGLPARDARQRRLNAEVPVIVKLRMGPKDIGYNTSERRDHAVRNVIGDVHPGPTMVVIKLTNALDVICVCNCA